MNFITWGARLDCEPGTLLNLIIMDAYRIKRALRDFQGSESYHKHLFPGKSPILLTDGCDFIRDKCNAHWLFDAILSYQCEKILKDVNFQVWELRQLRKDLSWALTCREDSDKKPLIIQFIQFSDFPLEEIKIWVIDKVALLPSEY
jgi:hypothetical protein